MRAGFSKCPMEVGTDRPSSTPTPSLSYPTHLPPIHLPPSHPSASSFSAHHTSRSSEPSELYHHHPYSHAFNDNASRNYPTGPGTAYEYTHTRRPQTGNTGAANSRPQIKLSLPQLPLPPIVPSPHSLLQTPHQYILPLAPPPTQGASSIQSPSSTLPAQGRHPSVVNIGTGVSPERGQTPLPQGRRDSNTNAHLYRPSTSHSHRNSQSSLYFMPIAAAEDRRESASMETDPAMFSKATGTDISKPSLDLQPALSPFPHAIPTRHMSTIAPPVLTPPKSRRVRTGCLTCRERHLKCDEGVPDCANCRKGARECKRGVRLNFIDIKTKPIPFIPEVTCWKVSFMDESRIIADEYAGGLDRYPRAPIVRLNTSPCTTDQAPIPGGMFENGTTTSQPPLVAFQETRMVPLPNTQPSCFAPQQPQHPLYSQNPQYPQYHYPQYPQFPHNSLQNNTRNGTEALVEVDTRNFSNFLCFKYDQKDDQCDSPRSETSSVASSMVPQGAGGPSPMASLQADVGNTPTSVDVECDLGDEGNDTGLQEALPEGLPTPPSERFGLIRGDGTGERSGVAGRPDDVSSSKDSNSGERDYLQSPEEVLYMRVFVEKVGSWMDSLNKDNFFGRVIPRMAIKSPMMHNAFLACGAKHLSLVDDAYRNGRALHYYDTATTQLLRGLQNPDRDVAESATAAVILSVYEAMNERYNDRKIHTIGARGLIKDCGWTAKSKDIGGACFWLSIGLEVLSCLEFKWAMAWDPDQWGLDDEFTSDVAEHESGSKQTATKARRPAIPSQAMSAITGGDGEQVWTHRILYIVAKVANFRASVPRFQEPSPHDEQFRLQDRFSEWKALKSMCDKWNDDCPQSMRPYSYLLPVEGDTSGSLFPNIWLLEPTAVVGRLFYHTAMVLLHQVNPVEPSDSRVNLNAQRHHAHQVCGIIAHSNDMGIASVAARSLAISALVLSDVREQNEAYTLLRNISKATGWKIGHVCAELQGAWGRDLAETNAPSAATAPVLNNNLPPPSDLPMAGVFSGSLGSVPNQNTNVGLHPGLGPGFPTAFLSQRGSFSPPSQSPADGRLHLPGSSGGPEYGRTSHLRMESATSIISSGTLTGTATPHLSPLTATAYRSPLVNPLQQADLGQPDHPYKTFYRLPNDSARSRLSF